MFSLAIARFAMGVLIAILKKWQRQRTVAFLIGLLEVLRLAMSEQPLVAFGLQYVSLECKGLHWRWHVVVGAIQQISDALTTIILGVLCMGLLSAGTALLRRAPPEPPVNKHAKSHARPGCGF